MKTSSEIRKTFLTYFADRGHKQVRSSSLIPENDSTLLFTNAGMNQFKDVFLGLEKRHYTRATSSQKCMRVSGKHNDLEAVGRTTQHHTFFEMLGNFSFGNYFKKEAVEYAWELCTDVYGLARNQLYITVFREDEEAFTLWRRHIGIAETHISRLDALDNFWTMGKTGPCGPCSELHYDFTVSPAGHTDCTIGCDCGRYVEIWNLVFMQFNRDASGRITSLPSPSIDTGMGLERIASVLQGVRSNYDSDLFRPLLEEASRLTGVSYGEDEREDVSLRILADHSRASTFLISDGVVPGSTGRGYVLRKILRRAIRHGKMLGTKKPFIYTLTALVSELMKETYPELEVGRDYMAKVVKYEEEKFGETLSHGMHLFDEIFEKTTGQGKTSLPGNEIFRLYDTFGFPLDLAREIASERQVQIDEKGFYAELEKQRERARASWKGGKKVIKKIYQELADQGLHTKFSGYTQITDVPGHILAILKGERTIEELSDGETGAVILDRSPFYAEAGGQIADKGIIESETDLARVEEVYSPVTGLRLHEVKVLHGGLKPGDSIRSTVSSSERQSTARNHTATHLLHAALRQILGDHVKQSGSLVAPDRLRFDFTHYRALSPAEIREIEESVNQKIRENIPVRTKIRDLEEAIQKGAMALFGEKYQERVRVVEISGFSTELCGGTHVDRTGDIALMKIHSESSISAGVRRIEALTGESALSHFLEDEDVLNKLADDLQVRRAQLVQSIEKISRELKEAKKQIEQLQLKVAQNNSCDALEKVREIKGIRVLSQQVENLDQNSLRVLADQLKNRLKSGVVVLGMALNGKVSLIAMVTPDLTDQVKANDLIQEIAQLLGGGGGGKADMAEAGGKDPSQLGEALDHVYRFVAKCVRCR